MTLISVIIPVYNTEKYLEKCLNSVINQTLKDIEIICINDGSTDNSLEILKKFQSQDKRIKISLFGISIFVIKFWDELIILYFFRIPIIKINIDKI